MITRAPGGWWEYAAALRELAPNDGTWATGLAWAEACWTWRRGLSEAEVLRTAPRLSLEELRVRYRPIGERTLRLHLRQLVQAGLLELARTHGRGRPNTYVPRVPTTWRVTGSPLPVNEADYRQPVAGNRPTNTGNPLPNDRQPVAAAHISPETVQTPPSRTRAHAPTRVIPEDGGGLSPDERQTAETALVAIVAKMPPDAMLDPAWTGRLLVAVAALRADGWLPGQLATVVSSKSWAGVGHPSSVLLKRLQGLAGHPAPSSRPAARPPHCGGCEYERRVLFDEHGSPDPSQPCPNCHPTKALEVAAAGGIAL